MNVTDRIGAMMENTIVSLVIFPAFILGVFAGSYLIFGRIGMAVVAFALVVLTLASVYWTAFASVKKLHNKE